MSNNSLNPHDYQLVIGYKYCAIHIDLHSCIVWVAKSSRNFKGSLPQEAEGGEEDLKNLAPEEIEQGPEVEIGKEEVPVIEA